MRKLFLTLLTIVAAVSSVLTAAARPQYRFSVKVGVDTHTIDSLGGLDWVKKETARMFNRINEAFASDERFVGEYSFEVDWDAFYVYDGISTKEVYKPHPDHDYLVIIDGYKSSPEEQGGGWYGSEWQCVYHSRIHNDRFNNPFEPGAIDGIIHEFGHARGMPDIYAMVVNADRNPISHTEHRGVRCIMNYPYGERHWSTYAVNMINLAADRRVEIDDLVAAMCPEKIVVNVTAPDGQQAKGAKVRLYPVGWYSYSVLPEVLAEFSAGEDGAVEMPGDIYGHWEEFGLRYPNLLVEAEWEGHKSYGWLPLYEVQLARFDGSECYVLNLHIKGEKPTVVKEFNPEEALQNLLNAKKN